ncbi:STAS domain-containing protein [Kribbella italica]|uniref:Anti-anti-sigma regulatory factor n=1 Tax=Kribbella italica TaxID=1540520 RepID=A0A7W9J691_9ACTN|nr:STAS domain-containing protein [Kribbella italica]MBB5835872.1 anti-anti-sigma regulatory factor [Kribbella italica]
MAVQKQVTGDTRQQTPQITVQVADGMIVVAATGRIGRFVAAELRDDLLQIWPACAGILAVDLSACTYLSVDAVRTLQEIWRRPTRAGGELRVLANHPDVVTALDDANIPRIRASGSSARRGSPFATSTAAPS